MKDLYTEHVLKDAIAGDANAFGILYEYYIDRIYNYVYYRTGNKDDAEDLTERVFIKAMEHINNYKDYGLPFSAWLYRIAHNLVANWHRDNSRRKEIPLDERIVVNSQSEFPENELVHLEEREYLMRIIRNLPDDRQQLLILKFVNHLSNAEIGEILGRTEGAIKSLYHRTLLSLREEIISRDRDYYLVDKVFLDPVSDDQYL